MADLKISPPPFPNREEYPFVATVRFRKMVIDIENLDGSTREGKDPNGKPWKTEFRGVHYGEIRDSRGTDGDPLDVYIKNPPDDNANKAYIVHQNHPRTHPSKGGQYDEDKVVLGVSSAEEAKELYLRHYNRKDFFRSITEMAIEPFKRYIFGENKAEKVARYITESELRSYSTDPEKIKRAAKYLIDRPRATAFIRDRMRGSSAMPNECKTPGEKIRSKGQGRGKARGKGRGPIGIPIGKKEKDMKKESNIREYYKLGYELGMKDKLAQFGATSPLAGPALTAAMTSTMPQQQPPGNVPAAKPRAGMNAPNWPSEMPQHGGPTTPLADIKKQMQPLSASMFKSPLSSKM